ncbi:Zinc finger, C3HC4 type (RING finger) [Musa troglodytarum]|uniref:RING-type E3 ubiquitin transferase n=1 Tax=Musa troglodytarum TaxID=320322 RepID=A0A9E7KWC5_9LILI|nr:Zinc finger, C3HC4 type (RING finger) [Musa troglodytarum]
MPNNRSTPWCYQCRQRVRPRERDMLCPNCDSSFVMELDDTMSHFVGMDPDAVHEPWINMMEAISVMTREGRTGRRPHGGIMRRPNMNSGSGMEFGSGPWLLFRGQIPFSLMGDRGYSGIIIHVAAVNMKVRPTWDVKSDSLPRVKHDNAPQPRAKTDARPEPGMALHGVARPRDSWTVSYDVPRLRED